MTTTAAKPKAKGPKITAIAPWFGSKRTLAPRIVAELGKHSAYWEPFCGSMAVLLEKEESSHETVNDLHGDLINLARVIADETESVLLYAKLSRVLFDECRRDLSLKMIRESKNPIEQAFHYFIISWFGRNGFSGTKGCEKSSFAVRWTPNGGHGGQRFASAVDSIPSWHQRMRRTTILHRDGFEVIGNIDDNPKTAIYVDPPYYEKNATYEHDFDPPSHERLAKLLSRFKQARVVVSYYDHHVIRKLYEGWTLVDCSINKGLHNAGKRGQTGAKAPEVLLINGPSYTEGGGGMFK